MRMLLLSMLLQVVKWSYSLSENLRRVIVSLVPVIRKGIFSMMSFENRGPAYQGLAPTLWFKQLAVIKSKFQVSIALSSVEGRSLIITIVCSY